MCAVGPRILPPKSGLSPGTLGKKMSEEESEDRCFLCGEAEELREHHLVPKFMTRFYPSLKGRGGTIDLCPTCHDKVHYLLEPIRLALKHEVELEASEE